ncbi:MAG: rhodanese-like domain-containing protein [Sphaerochaetaceae bacterium]|nr:rhodanese-like domain-containing protein [Sphaerochaetaceae bacterium]
MNTKITLLLALILLIVIVFVSCAAKTNDTSTQGTYKKISAQKAKEMMEAHPDAIILDVRTSSEYAEGHIQNATLLPNETISATQRPGMLPDLDAMILVYCRSGNRSAQAAKKLVALGYTSVYDFGGIGGWPYGIVK